MPESSPPRIAVLGGGIAGLAAAHRLVELGQPAVLFEAGPTLGGVLSTVHKDGFQVERSADNFITTIPYGVDLCRRLGLIDQLVQTNPAHRHTYVVRAGRLCRLPDGFLMMAPTRMWPLALTPILSPLGKLRAALEYFIPPRRDDSDESMAQFVRRRLGREAFERLVEPLVSAVYAADMEKLSLMSTLSRFREMEREYGSLIRAMRKQMKDRPKGKSESGARYSMFVTLRDGLSTLVDAISARLPAGSVRLNSPVERIERAGKRWRLHITCGRSPDTGCGRSPDRATLPTEGLQPAGRPAVEDFGGVGRPAPNAEGGTTNSEDFDALIVATPSHVAAKLLAGVDAELAAGLEKIEHSGTAIVSLGYDLQQIGHPLDGMGAVVPSIEKSPILACSFSSQKYPHRAPEGKTLLRVFVGGARRPELAEMSDAELYPLVLKHLEPLFKIRGEPVFCDIAHWPRTMPQYHVGHRERVAQIEARVAALPGLQLAGNAFHGVGVPDCIHGGEQAADRLK